jgi:hypothetical protein
MQCSEQCYNITLKNNTRMAFFSHLTALRGGYEGSPSDRAGFAQPLNFRFLAVDDEVSSTRRALERPSQRLVVNHRNRPAALAHHENLVLSIDIAARHKGTGRGNVELPL